MTLRLSGDTSGFTEIKAADAAGDNSINLPANNGSANQLLQNGGTAGELQYTSAGGGLHYDSDGRLLVGRSSAPDNDGALVIQGYAGVTAGEGTIQLLRGNNVTTTAQGLGSIDFGHDQHLGASIDAVSEAAWTEGLSHPTRLTFSTTATGSDAPTARVEIANSGELKLLAGCPGIDFSGTQGAADTGVVNGEVLGNYEEGQFLPTVTGGGTPASTLTVHRTYYTRVGRLVTLQVYVVFSGGDTGTFQLGNLPFLLDSTTAGMAGSGGSNGAEGIGSVMIGNVHTANELNNLVAYGWTNYIRFYYTPTGSNSSWTPLNGESLGGTNSPGGANILFTITYITADA